MSLPDWDAAKVRQIQASGGRAVIKFWAPWCGPCKALAPVVEAAAAQHPDTVFGQVNLDEQPEVGRLFGVRGLPTIIGLENGGVVWNQVGLIPANALETRLTKWR